MRISCVGFARLQDDQGRYALLVNRRRLEQTGHRSLSPIGGALKVKGQGRLYLERLGATYFEGDQSDLRFQMPDEQVSRVATWFQSRQERETRVMREFREELVDEAAVLRRGDLRGVAEQYSSFHRHYTEVQRTDVRDRRTTYLIEIFDVTLPPRVMDKLTRAAKKGPANKWLVHFVTRSEIRNRNTFHGTRISDLAQYVLNP